MKGYGYADTLFQDPNTPRTKFFIGSITKQFTAAAILILHQRGQLDLNDRITEYLPDYPMDPGDRITIHQLLSHTSGLPNYTDFPEVLDHLTSNMNPADIIATFRDRPLLFEPGTDFAYSNSGYILLGAIIESVSGQSYEAFLHKEIFKPLGMLDTGYGRREVGHPGRAEGYTMDEAGKVIGALPIRFSILHSAGALFSTVEDMLRWDRALLDGTILSPYSVALMLTQHSDSYGYGWWLESRYGRLHALHDGFLDGYNCTFDRWLDGDLSVIVFSNEDEAPVAKTARGLASIVLGRKPVIPLRRKPIEVDQALLAGYAGVYRNEIGVERVVTLMDDTLHTFTRGEPPRHLLAETDRRFFFVYDNTETLEFQKDSDGAVTGLIYSDGENRWQWRRVDEP